MMVYFASPDEMRWVQRGLLGEARHEGVRGEGCATDLDARHCEELWRLRSFEARRVLERVLDVLGTVGAIAADALTTLALPIAVDVPLSGRYLGLVGRVVADAISFRDGVV